jgi:uncharacterized protein YkwD
VASLQKACYYKSVLLKGIFLNRRLNSEQSVTQGAAIYFGAADQAAGYFRPTGASFNLYVISTPIAHARRKYRMRKIFALVGVASLFALSDCASPSTAAEKAATVNAFRTAHGRTALRDDASLAMLAQTHASDMARREALDHAGFMQSRGPAGARAENVAYGCADSACAVRMWINSSGHRANMLLRDVNSYGLASAVSKSGRRYWALELGH